MEVQVEVTPRLFSDRIGGLEACKPSLAKHIEHTLGLRVRGEPGGAAHAQPQRRQGQTRLRSTGDYNRRRGAV